ncbi:hypothetical protein BIW11_08235 [Tropilaelaps mercedesae]|uniref:Uncharacterized protein n=1 Tax=Tropilaelaps mercedesae TaxID=418985 RepID=A0A1V9XQF6_9ACAR|nr:hypothetical protein BIW11_08235 [Tropilaelaps mercedesae]
MPLEEPSLFDGIAPQELDRVFESRHPLRHKSVSCFQLKTCPSVPKWRVWSRSFVTTFLRINSTKLKGFSLEGRLDIWPFRSPLRA